MRDLALAALRRGKKHGLPSSTTTGRLACVALNALSRGGSTGDVEAVVEEVPGMRLLPLGMLSRVIERKPVLGTTVCALCYILIELIGFPSSPIAILLGASYDIPAALAICLSSGLVSAVAAFFIGRTRLRAKYLDVIEGNPKLRAIALCIRESSFETILLLRLVPMPPVINYIYGATAAHLRGYIFATLIGNMPGTLLAIMITKSASVPWQVAVCFAAAFVYASVVAGRTLTRKLAAFS